MGVEELIRSKIKLYSTKGDYRLTKTSPNYSSNIVEHIIYMIYEHNLDGEGSITL